MAITLGALKIDDELVLKQLRQDLKDDWFPDPRKFDDVFNKDLVQKILRDNVESNHGEFRPGVRHALNMPKSNFTLRSALETSISDRVMYHALAAALVPLYDPLIPWQAFSHRYNDHELAEKHLFRSSVQSWMAFIGVVRSTLIPDADSPPAYALLSTDLTNYYDNIDIRKLKEGLEKLLPETSASAAEKADASARIQTLFKCLNDWTYKPGYGLPQNRDASSFLANIYMLGVDRAMLSKGYKYFRYMDDIKIVCDDSFDARKALKDLSIELRNIGLYVNSKKTVICDPGDAEKVDNCLDTLNTELLELDAIWKTKRVRVISRSFVSLRDLTIRLLEAGLVDSREFRFCISRLELLAVCEEFSPPAAYFADITPHIIEALWKFPAATDQLAKYIRSVPTSNVELSEVAQHLMHSKRNIYSWQNYRLWVLLAQKNYRQQELADYAKAIVQEATDGPTRCGATMYLGATGGIDERILIADNFHTLMSFMGQRSALIAIQELRYKDHVAGPVQPHVRDDLKGVWRGLNREGVYFAPPERRSIRWLVEGERDYE
ncbi:RNA-directed DNA polymerase [Dyella sp. 2YAF14]|uniref:RNA-directed DNA polymerase n=1 Tax=Dyella sp. 2YAF14 TaxID=3233025 RepID=UPI003F8DA3E1